MTELYSTAMASQNIVMPGSWVKRTKDKSIHGNWQNLNNQAHVLTESKATSVCNYAFRSITLPIQ